MLQINQNIKKYRELNGFTQGQIAAKLGVKRTTYANWEGDIEPSLTMIMELAKIFDIHYTQLIDETNIQISSESDTIFSRGKKEDFLKEIIKLRAEINTMQVLFTKFQADVTKTDVSVFVKAYADELFEQTLKLKIE